MVNWSLEQVKNTWYVNYYDKAKKYWLLKRWYFDIVDLDEIVSDKYFTIEAEWNYWDYKIDNIIFEPTITESILRSFTTIF